MTDKQKIEELTDEIDYLKMCLEEEKREKTKYIQMIKEYEDELKKYMSDEEYTAFATKVAKMSFFAEVMASPNEEFKKTVLENWEDITRGV